MKPRQVEAGLESTRASDVGAAAASLWVE